MTALKEAVGKKMSSQLKRIEVIVDEVYLEKGDIVIESKTTGKTITVRKFQEDVVHALAGAAKYIVVEALTGSGKTFCLLAPLIANMMYGTRYEGIVGIYPTKPLVNDQFLSIKGILDSLGERTEALSGKDGSEIAIKYRMGLSIFHETKRFEKDATVGLVKLTAESLDKMQESLGKAVGRVGLLDLIRETLLDAEYIISVAVPEYPYMLLSSMYRSIPDAQKILSLVAEGDFVYREAKKIAGAGDRDLGNLIWDLKRELSNLFEAKPEERAYMNIYSALFSELMFLDEFHVWNVYERPTILILVLLHHLESLRSARPERYKVIFSSATPIPEFFDVLKNLGLGPVEMVRAEPTKNSSNADRVRSRLRAVFVAVPTKPRAGPVAWFRVEDFLPKIVEELSGEIAAKERAIVFGRRNAVVEECAEIFHEKTGKVPAVVTGVKTRFPGKEALEKGKESGELFVFGNYSVELGVDLRRIHYIVAYGVAVGEVVQRVGRGGRGDVDEATAVIPIPEGYLKDVERRCRVGRLSYGEFIELLREILPERLGIESYGTELIMGHEIGKLRAYLPLASYVLAMIYLWEYSEELRKLVAEFIRLIEALRIPSIFPWLRKVSKSPSVLVPLASFRVSVSMPYIRDGIEDYASLSTLLGNYEVVYENGKLRITGINKKSVGEVLTLEFRAIPEEFIDTVVSSKLLIALNNNIILQHSNRILYTILKSEDIPLYIAPPGDDYELFNAFGYAIKVEVKGGDPFYMLLL